MNNDDPLSDLEARLRAWRPAGMPTALRTRLLAAESAQRRKLWRRRAGLAGACALAVALLLLVVPASLPDEENDPVAAMPSRLRPTVFVETLAEPRWVLGESLTMNIDMGVPPGIVPAALRLDGNSVAASGLFPVRSADGKLPLKVDCQF